jgi:hypothetical protein
MSPLLKGRLPASLANIRLGYKLRTIKNTVAYCGAKIIATVKILKVQAPPSRNFCKATHLEFVKLKSLLIYK